MKKLLAILMCCLVAVALVGSDAVKPVAGEGSGYISGMRFESVQEFVDWIESPLLEVDVMSSDSPGGEPKMDFEHTVYSDFQKMFAIDRFYLIPDVPESWRLAGIMVFPVEVIFSYEGEENVFYVFYVSTNEGDPYEEKLFFTANINNQEYTVNQFHNTMSDSVGSFVDGYYCDLQVNPYDPINDEYGAVHYENPSEIEEIVEFLQFTRVDLDTPPPTTPASLVVMRIDDLYAAVNGTRVKIHDTKDLAPVYSSTGKAMVPFRFISTAFGAEVDWDESTGSVIIDYNDIHLVMPIGQTTVYVNGNPVVIPTPAQIIDGNTFVPIKVVTDQLELTTEWDGDTVSIVTSDEEIDLEAAIAQAEAILGRSPHVLAELSMLIDNQKSKILLKGSQKDGCSVVSGKTLVTADKLVYMKSGASVNISGNTATVSYDNKTLTATAGDDFITIDSVQQNNQPVRIISGQFFVPLEAVAAFLDLDVDYDGVSKYIVSDQNVVTFDDVPTGDMRLPR